MLGRSFAITQASSIERGCASECNAPSLVEAYDVEQSGKLIVRLRGLETCRSASTIGRFWKPVLTHSNVGYTIS